jgi:hypothetical protein
MAEGVSHSERISRNPLCSNGFSIERASHLAFAAQTEETGCVPCRHLQHRCRLLFVSFLTF